MKMIKIISFIITIALCLCFISCSSESKERIFLHVPTLNGGSGESGFADSLKYGVHTSSHEETFSELSDSTKKLSFDNGKICTYKESTCYYKTSDSKEYGTFYSIYDRYICEGTTAEYLHGTDLLCYYSVMGGREDIVLSERSKEVAKKMADEFLLGFLSQDTLNKFDQVTVEENVSNTFSYRVSYRRFIEGYKTDEALYVSFNDEGKLRGYNGFNLNKYDTLADGISKEMLDEAKEALLDKLYSTKKLDFEHKEPQIITDKSGNVYLEIQYSYRYEEGGAINVRTVAVSVN